MTEGWLGRGTTPRRGRSTAAPPRHFDRSRAQHGGVEKPRPHGLGGFSTARLRRFGRNDEWGDAGREVSPLRAARSGRNDGGVAEAGNDATTGRSTAGPTSSFRPEPCAARRPHLVISTGAVRSTAEWRNLVPMGREVSPLRAFGASVEMTSGVAGAGNDATTGRSTAAPPRHFDRSRAQHGGVEKPHPHGQGGFSTARLRRSGRNDERGGWGGERRHDGGAARRPHLVISTGAVRSTAEWRNLVPMGWEVSPLRAFGASVEMTSGGDAGREVSPLRAARSGRNDEGVAGAGNDATTGAQHGGPTSSFRPEPCAARRSGETSSPWAGRFLHCALPAPVEMTSGSEASPFDKLRVARPGRCSADRR